MKDNSCSFNVTIRKKGEEKKRKGERKKEKKAEERKGKKKIYLNCLENTLYSL